MSAVVPAVRSSDAGDADAGTAQSTDAYAQLTALIAHVAVVAVGLNLSLVLGASAALPLAVVLLPLWVPVLRNYPLAILIGGLAALSVASGLVLAELSSVDHQVSQVKGLQAIGLLGSGIAALVLLLWARAQMSLHRVVVLYGAGALASTFVDGQLDWKFHLAVPVALVALGLIERHRTGAVSAAVILLVGVIAVMDEGRSLFGASVFAATLTVWQLRPRSAGRRERRWFPVALLAGVAGAVYFFTTAMATGGGLGETLQERSVVQTESGGSLLAGGRPEWAATRELVKLNPSGYGLGVAPNSTDRTAGTEGLASINVEVDEFRDRFMFGDQIELHSVAADLWANYGWVGVGLAAAIVVALVRSLSFALAARRAPTYVIFACSMALWYVLFGTMFSNWLDVSAAVALALAAARVPPTAPAVLGGTRSEPPPEGEATSPW